jgi:hypothetical protein
MMPRNSPFFHGEVDAVQRRVFHRAVPGAVYLRQLPGDKNFHLLFLQRSKIALRGRFDAMLVKPPDNTIIQF